MRLELDMNAVEAAAVDGLVDAAEPIAQDTTRNAIFAEVAYQPNIRIEVSESGVTVKTDNPFAVLDEWGSARSAANAPMRRAAAEHGRFEPS